MGNKYCLCVFILTGTEISEMSLQMTWTQIKRKNPSSTAEMMRIIFECNPDITEHEIISWQRTSHDWTTGIFDFVWFAFQVHHGHLEWLSHVQKMWPVVKTMVDEHCLEELIGSMSL